ncbi:hypothetical protein D3C85_1399740 [compost metagenome]
MQDQRIEGFEADHFAGPLLGQAFTDFQAPHQALYQQCCGEAQGPQRADLQVVVGAGRVAEAYQQAQPDDAERADSGNQQADMPAQQGVADRHRHDQQIANGAGHAATGVEQAAQQQHVGQRETEQLRRATGVLKKHHQQNIEYQVQPAASAQQVVIGELQQLVVHVAGDQQHQGEADA